MSEAGPSERGSRFARQLDLLRSLAWVSGLKSDAPSDDDEEEVVEAVPKETQLTWTKAISLAVGCVFGRWDLRQWLDKDTAYSPQNPYEALPVCPPASLRGSDGLPARSGAFDETGYPIPIEWLGILADEEHHRADMCGRTLECLSLVFTKDSHSVGEDICREFGLSDAREYFRNPRYFLQVHLNEYFKSRRRAPIYWQIAIPSKRYSVWLYYHRLNRDTFWRILNDFVKPKLVQEERRLSGLRSETGDTPTPSQRRAVQEQESFIAELASFRDCIETIAPLWNPDLSDGVLVNFAPLWKLVPHHPSWQRELRDCWQKLCTGAYDWAHLAMHLWPERVVPKCCTDRSLAIAHGLHDKFWEELPDGKWKEKKVSTAEIRVLVDERSSKAVKSALDGVLGISVSRSASQGGRGSARRNA